MYSLSRLSTKSLRIVNEMYCNTVYEMSIIISDANIDNPIIWNFGKIEAKFRKPLDPSNLSMTYKNIQKPKMEPSFPPEVSLNKNFIVKSINIVWCTIQWNYHYFIILLPNIPKRYENQYWKLPQIKIWILICSPIRTITYVNCLYIASILG